MFNHRGHTNCAGNAYELHANMLAVGSRPLHDMGDQQFHVSYVVYTLPFRPHCSVSCGHDSISQQTPAPPWHWASAIFT